MWCIWWYSIQWNAISKETRAALKQSLPKSILNNLVCLLGPSSRLLCAFMVRFNLSDANSLWYLNFHGQMLKKHNQKVNFPSAITLNFFNKYLCFSQRNSINIENICRNITIHYTYRLNIRIFKILSHFEITYRHEIFWFLRKKG